MSHDAVKWALEKAPMVKTLKGHDDITARLVLVALAHCANAETGDAFPTVSTLSYRTGAQQRTVQRALRTLEAQGLIRKVGSRNTSNGPIPVWHLSTSQTRPEEDKQAMFDKIEKQRRQERERWQGRQWLKSVADDIHWNYTDA
jgi:DNA-binding transcriptional regulator YhcF (GntR family)